MFFFAARIAREAITAKGRDELIACFIFELVPDFRRVIQTVTSTSDIDGRSLEAGPGISS